MTRLNPTIVVLFALAISVVSLIVAAAAVRISISAQGPTNPQALKQLTIPEPKALTADNPAAKLPHAEGLRPVGGTVKSVSASAIVLVAGNGEQTVSISATTKLYQQGAQKDPVVYQKEMQAFQDTLRNAMGATETFVSPYPYETTEVSISDFKSGMQALALVGGDGTAVQVTVLSSSGPNR